MERRIKFINFIKPEKVEKKEKHFCVSVASIDFILVDFLKEFFGNFYCDEFLKEGKVI